MSQEIRYIYSEYFADDTSLCQMKLTSFSITAFSRSKRLGIKRLAAMIWRLVFKRGKILSAGRLNKKSLGIVMLLSVGLLLAGCSGSKSSDTGTYSGSVYTVKRGDTLYRISRTTGTSVKELARLNGISPLTPLKLVRN